MTRAALILLAGAAGCLGAPLPGPPACDAGPSPPSLARDVQPIFEKSCTGVECHTARFRPGHTWENIVAVPAPHCDDGRLLVVPYDPSRSYLLDKLAGTHLCFGSRMPKIGPPLPDDQIRILTTWICAGAPNN